MKTTDEIYRAHDMLTAILLREVPSPFGNDTKAQTMLTSACDVLCWVLEHDHNQHFADNLRRIEEFLLERGLQLRKAGADNAHEV